MAFRIQVNVVGAKGLTNALSILENGVVQPLRNIPREDIRSIIGVFQLEDRERFEELSEGRKRGWPRIKSPTLLFERDVRGPKHPITSMRELSAATRDALVNRDTDTLIDSISPGADRGGGQLGFIRVTQKPPAIRFGTTVEYAEEQIKDHSTTFRLFGDFGIKRLAERVPVMPQQRRDERIFYRLKDWALKRYKGGSKRAQVPARSWIGKYDDSTEGLALEIFAVAWRGARRKEGLK
jgi:hypothetical protein